MATVVVHPSVLAAVFKPAAIVPAFLTELTVVGHLRTVRQAQTCTCTRLHRGDLLGGGRVRLAAVQPETAAAPSTQRSVSKRISLASTESCLTGPRPPRYWPSSCGEPERTSRDPRTACRRQVACRQKGAAAGRRVLRAAVRDDRSPSRRPPRWDTGPTRPRVRTRPGSPAESRLTAIPTAQVGRGQGARPWAHSRSELGRLFPKYDGCPHRPLSARVSGTRMPFAPCSRPSGSARSEACQN